MNQDKEIIGYGYKKNPEYGHDKDFIVLFEELKEGDKLVYEGGKLWRLKK